MRLGNFDNIINLFPWFFSSPVGFSIGRFWIWLRVQPAETRLHAVSHVSHQRLLRHLHILLQGEFSWKYLLWLRRSLASILHLHTWGCLGFWCLYTYTHLQAVIFSLTSLLLYCFFRRVTAWGRSWQRWRPSEISCVGRWTHFRNTLTAVQTLCLKMSCRGIKVRPPVLLLLSKDQTFVL